MIHLDINWLFKLIITPKLSICSMYSLKITDLKEIRNHSCKPSCPFLSQSCVTITYFILWHFPVLSVYCMTRITVRWICSFLAFPVTDEKVQGKIRKKKNRPWGSFIYTYNSWRATSSFHSRTHSYSLGSITNLILVWYSAPEHVGL